MKKIKGIWFYGISGAGKSYASKIIKKKKNKNFLILDGDEVRKFISYDLGYSLSDRRIQISRVFGLSMISLKSKIFPIISTVFMTREISKKIKKNNILLCKISRDISKIKGRKKIYKLKTQDVVGRDIRFDKNLKNIVIENNSTKKSFSTAINKIFKQFDIK